jgi:hypothetical protein
MAYIRNQESSAARKLTARSPLVAQGCRLFQNFHGFPMEKLIVMPCRREMPEVLVRLGQLRGVIYSSGRGDGVGKTYIHFMEDPPLLTCDPKGSQLYVVGGSYRITRKGIEG